jgi:hypothetical protein
MQQEVADSHCAEAEERQRARYEREREAWRRANQEAGPVPVQEAPTPKISAHMITRGAKGVTTATPTTQTWRWSRHD